MHEVKCLTLKDGTGSILNIRHEQYQYASIFQLHLVWYDLISPSGLFFRMPFTSYWLFSLNSLIFTEVVVKSQSQSFLEACKHFELAAFPSFARENT